MIKAKKSRSKGYLQQIDAIYVREFSLDLLCFEPLVNQHCVGINRETIHAYDFLQDGCYLLTLRYVVHGLYTHFPFAKVRAALRNRVATLQELHIYRPQIIFLWTVTASKSTFILPLVDRLAILFEIYLADAVRMVDFFCIPIVNFH